MILQAVLSLVYGNLVLAGGIVGYRKAGSRPSLIAGVASDALMCLAAVLLFFGNRGGLFLGVGVAALLLLFFVVRWLKGGRFMPAGLMVLSSALTLLLLLWTRS
jgi:uncharacterized membrane protein (UPF0136 family)